MVAKNIIWVKDQDDDNLPSSCVLPDEILFNIYDVYDYLTNKYHCKIKQLILVKED